MPVSITVGTGTIGTGTGTGTGTGSTLAPHPAAGESSTFRSAIFSTAPALDMALLGLSELDDHFDSESSTFLTTLFSGGSSEEKQAPRKSSNGQRVK